MKREAINHTKMRRLARYLGIEIWGARGIMESLWSATRDEAPAGNIGKLSDEDIADFIGWTEGAADLVKALIRAGWLDATPAYRLVVHDWPDHCEDYIHAKLAMLGLRFANGSAPKTRKLNEKQRKAVPSEFVMPPTDCRPAADVAAIGADMSAQSLHVSADGSADVAATNAVPYLALPSHAIPSQATTTAVVVEMPRMTEYPKTDAAVRRRFATADLMIVVQIIQAATQAFLSVDTPKIPVMGDADFAAAVEQAWNEASNQTSAALFKTTVPAVVRTWCLHGRHPPLIRPGKLTVADSMKQLAAERIAKGQPPL